MEIRALQIDLARQKENLPYVFSYIDLAEQGGYNTLVLYLENAVRTKSFQFFSEKDTYSQEEIIKIIDYATSKGIDVVPALETLGHLEKFFAYDELIPLAEKDEFEVGRKLYGHKYTCGCVSNPDFISFMDTYIKEVVALFPGKFVHVGLDETFNFAVCEKCQERIRNGESAKELFLKHVLHVYEVISSLGKTMMMWDDFFEYFDVVESLPRDIIMCNWNYMFVQDEPGGHWTNRVKKDWFALYDKLGIKYIFCGCSHRASSTYSIDSFYDYATKYHPIGALMTAWERSDSFYLGAYPCVIYAGKLWKGEIQKKDKVDVYASYLQDREVAEVISSLNVIGTSGFGDITKKTESDYLVKFIARDTLKYALPKLKAGVERASDGVIKDVLLDVYSNVLEQYLGLSMQRAGVEYFDKKDKSQILETVKFVRESLKEIKKNGEYLWKKYRDGIVSNGDKFEGKFKAKFALLDKIENNLKDDSDFGVLTLDLMLPESYATPRVIVEVEYEDGEFELLYKGGMKCGAVLFDVGGCYNHRVRMKDKKLNKLIFSTFGEGAMYPTHFRYKANGESYVASSVKKVRGFVRNEYKILRDDTRFAEMGYDDGVKHVNDVNLCKEIHTIEVTFEKLK